MPDTETLLWYRAPAADFLAALPLGNGSTGAMLYGQPDVETIELNHDTLWAGGPGDRNDYTAADRLPALRRAVLDDRDHPRAERIAETMQGPDTQPYQPLGTLSVSCPTTDEPSDYRRRLDLATAVHTSTFSSDGVRLTRSSFVSAPAGVLVHGITADRAGAVNLSVRLHTPHPARRQGELLLGRAPVDTTGADGIHYADDAGMGFGIGLRVLAEGGTVRRHPDGTVTVTGADAVTLLVATATGFQDWRTAPTGPDAALGDRITATLAAAEATGPGELRSAHLADHARLFDRAGLNLSSAPSPLPTDERLHALRAGADDPGLVALYFSYGRYLTIAGSRPGSQPMNLQGIWNRELRPPWNCDWTTNINTQMNYWPAESTNLAECHLPLLDLIGDLAEAGSRSARAYYGCDGWAVHHNVDLWRSSNPVGGGPQWANWPMAGPWLCAHLWQHYRYSGDRAFLAERAFPLMRGAVRFLLDFLTEDADGRLVTCPSTSPEHRFRAADGSLVAVDAMTAMDYWLTSELFDDYRSAAAVVAPEDELLAPVAAARARLARPLVDPEDGLLEWGGRFEDEDPGHRHLSHLYGLYPGSAVTEAATPELFAAADRALRRRLRHGGGGTGWSLAWVVALAARLGDAELAHRSLLTLLTDSTAPNLFDLHPPSIFQIDGNLGATAATVELLLRNTPDGVQLLPALPEAWPDGSAHGLRAHGGLTVDLGWRAGALDHAVLHTTHPGPVTVTSPGRAPVTLRTEADRSYRLPPE